MSENEILVELKVLLKKRFCVVVFKKVENYTFLQGMLSKPPKQNLAGG